MTGWRHRPLVLSQYADRQLPDPEITSPNNCQVLPSNFSNCICLIGAKSSALVETLMPGSNIGSFWPWMLAPSIAEQRLVSFCATFAFRIY
jgi:hypothetical protein